MRWCAALLLALAVVAAPWSYSIADPAAYPQKEDERRTPFLYDPVFDIIYDPAVVHFEPAPPRVEQCADLAGQVGRSFIFAHVTKGGTDYYWLDGWLTLVPPAAALAVGRPMPDC